jgi:2-haloacid dehalogenase
MMAGRLDCVIFDVGNVLIRWDPRNLYRKLLPDEAAIAAFLDETGLLAMNLAFDAGKPFREGIAELSGRFPHYRQELQAFDERWLELLDGAIEGSVALMGSIRRSGMPLYAITNFAREKFDLAVAEFPFLGAFDDIVVSGDVGLIKPDPAIFRLLIERRRIAPERALFIDDSLKNVLAARELGLIAHHFRSPEALAAELSGWGITP